MSLDPTASRTEKASAKISPRLRRARNRAVFQKRVVQWYRDHGRDFPWRRTTDPYRLLVAEIMLQRTRADQVLPVYRRFITRFPSEESARLGTPEEVSEILTPLGMQRKRTERLLRILAGFSRRDLAADPRCLQLFTGVGPYTSKAVAIFGLNEEGALLDTNVARILSRVFGLRFGKEPHKRSQNWEVARLLASRTRVREYHWGLIDLAAEVCRPTEPLCPICPLERICAYPRKTP